MNILMSKSTWAVQIMNGWLEMDTWMDGRISGQMERDIVGNKRDGRMEEGKE